MKNKTTPQSTNNRLLLGIDLGTSRSVVCASNGQQAFVDSYVGWPKDFVARKKLGKDVLFGEEALRHRLSVDLCRPLERGVIKEGSKDQEAVKALIQHLISLVNPADNQEVFAAVGVPAESFKRDKIAISRCLNGVTDALMVVSEPFAVAWGKDLLDNALIIDIGAGTTDFCIMHGTVPGEDDQRTLEVAGDFLDNKLFEALTRAYPKSSITLNMARQFKETLSFVGAAPSPVLVDIPVNGKAEQHDITEQMREACEHIVPGLVETTAELISRYDPEFQDAVRRNIVLAGGGSQIRGLAARIEKEIGAYGPCKVKVVDDAIYTGARGCLALAKDMPETDWEDPAVSGNA